MEVAYPEGFDVAWFACDKNGAVAAFISAGRAPIPEITLTSQFPDGVDCEQDVVAMPASSAVRLVVDPGIRDGYSYLAAKGMYVYDWLDIHRSRSQESHQYELVACPDKPAHMSGLPRELSVVFALTCFSDIAFAALEKIDPVNHFVCVAGSQCSVRP